MPAPRTRNCHWLVWQTAQKLAGALYEAMMKDNQRFAAWKLACGKTKPAELEAAFIALSAPKLIEQARATLAKSLRSSLDDSLKDTIADALIQDNLIRIGRDKSTGFRL